MYKLLCTTVTLSCLLLTSTKALSASTAKREIACNKHPLYCVIRQLNPSVEHDWAMRLSNLLYKYGKQHDLDPYRSLAIAMQESSLRETNRRDKFILLTEDCGKQSCKPTYEVINGISDMGVFQFHIRTILNNNIDPLRLNNDLEYAVATHFKILKDKYRICAKYAAEAWSCYHSKSPGLRETYIQAVNKYYPAQKGGELEFDSNKTLFHNPKPKIEKAKIKTNAKNKIVIANLPNLKPAPKTKLIKKQPKAKDQPNEIFPSGDNFA